VKKVIKKQIALNSSIRIFFVGCAMPLVVPPMTFNPFRTVGFLVIAVLLLNPFGASSQAQISTTPPTATQIVIPKDGEGSSANDCPVATAMGFDSHNTPYLINLSDPSDYGNIHYLYRGVWKILSVAGDLKRAGVKYVSDDMPESKDKSFGSCAAVEFDANDGMYLLLPEILPSKDTKKPGMLASGGVWLLYTPKFGEPFQVLHLNSRPFNVSMESRAGGNDLKLPPAIVYGVDLPRPSATPSPGQGSAVVKQSPWATTTSLISVVFPKIENGKLTLSSPITITRNGHGVNSHSGSFNIAVTHGANTFVSYLEFAEDIVKGGNPCWIAQISRSENRVTGQTFIQKAWPMDSDNHSVPSLAIDSTGILHYVTGSHGWQTKHPGFYYSSSVKPLDISEWITPSLMGHGQTYSGLLMNPDDSMTVIGRIHPALCFQNYSPQSKIWSAPETLACSESLPKPGYYSNFYDKGFVDRKGTEYVMFTFFAQQNNVVMQNGPHMLCVSEDKGKTWNLASTAIFRSHLNQPSESTTSP